MYLNTKFNLLVLYFYTDDEIKNTEMLNNVNWGQYFNNIIYYKILFLLNNDDLEQAQKCFSIFVKKLYKKI